MKTSLIVVGVAIAYVAVFWFVIAKARNRGERISAILIALLIPFWDLPFGYLTFQSYCRADAGIHAYLKIPPTKAIWIASTPGPTPEEASKYGVETVEYGKTGNIVRFIAGPSGFSKSSHQSPISAVSVTRIEPERLSWNIEKLSLLAIRVSDNQPIAQQIIYRWHGLWWQVGFGPLLGGGASCFGKANEPLVAAIARGIQ